MLAVQIVNMIVCIQWRAASSLPAWRYHEQIWSSSHLDVRNIQGNHTMEASVQSEPGRPLCVTCTTNDYMPWLLGVKLYITVLSFICK